MFTFLLGFIVSLIVLGTFNSFMSVAGPVLVPLVIGFCILRFLKWFVEKKREEGNSSQNQNNEINL